MNPWIEFNVASSSSSLEDHVQTENTVWLQELKKPALQKKARKTRFFSIAARWWRKDMNAVYKHIRRINNTKEKELLAIGQSCHESK